MQRSDFLNSLYAIAAAGPALAASSPKAVAGISIPDTRLAREATHLAASAEPPEIFAHSLRTFLFAELLGAERRVDHDVELVYVASILHDTGLCAQYMSDSERFEVDGANLAKSFLRERGTSDARIGLAWDAVALHDQSGIAKWKQPEVALVNAGVGADFGAHLSTLKREDVVAVLAAAPRDRFIEVLLDAVAAFARRKPQATGNSWVTDVAYRKVPGFHLDNFVDDVQDDPFKDYR
ncbi:MAG TPA: HD domain-containing protein [Candidatus Cybelea sp.]|nr:HD domain-containing protein [Candidatus Cybelea sp.]